MNNDTIEEKRSSLTDMVNLSHPRQKTLPTMYDLPSEEVGEPGLSDQFHPLQAELLRLNSYRVLMRAIAFSRLWI